MRRILAILTVVLAASGGTFAWAWCGGYGSQARRALSNDPEVRAKAIAALRERGPEGLAEVQAMREEVKLRIERAHVNNQPLLQQELQKLDALVDEVGGAKYCSVSNLYWYTDLDKAKAEAHQSKRPILSLRMLGKLNEEFSCANSRFFRTTLYANQDIAKTLREKFVLHWESVRPVPRVTIDFGDGRKLERTLTGNSIHYVLDANGQPLDGLPGLHGPAAFQAWLSKAEALASNYAQAEASQRDALLRDYHQQAAQAVAKAFADDLNRIRRPELSARPEANQALAALPTAKAAAEIAAPKRRVEIGIIREVANVSTLPTKMDELDEATWQRIAALHAEEAKLDDSSVALIRAENPAAELAGRLAVTKLIVEDPLVRLMRTLEASIALDTVRNEYVLHRRMHEWFAGGEVGRDIYPLNDRVYAELFLTPSSDPWLGLMPADTYTALKNNGVSTVQAKQ